MPNITVVIAPNIPDAERIQLMKQLEQSASDPDFVLCTNYELRIDVITPTFGNRVGVLAPGLTHDDVAVLHSAFTGGPSKYLSKKVPGLIVVNFEVCVFQFPLDRLNS